MKNFIKIGLILLLTNNLMAIDVKIKKVDDKFCKEYTEDDSTQKSTFCMEANLEYPIVSSDNVTFEKNINYTIAKYRSKKVNTKKYVLDLIKKGYGERMGHEDNMRIVLLLATKKVYSLAIYQQAYSGGAHGGHSVEIVNYDIVSNKKLTFDDLFLDFGRKEFIKIIEKEYRRQNNLKPNEGISKLDWFDNKFVLAKNIGITKKGLYLEYNPYEIKPYSAGETKVYIPYKLLIRFINPDTYLYPFVENL